MPARRLRLRRNSQNRDVAAWIAQRGSAETARKSAKYIKRIGGIFDDLAALRELRQTLFDDDESAGTLDDRIQELEQQQCHGDA